MPGSRPGHRIASVWLPDAFHRAIGLLAASRGETKSDLIRQAIVREAMAREETAADEQREERTEAAHR